MSPTLRPLAVFSLISALTTVVFAPGCSRQAEGERCDTVNGDSDCDDGLKCVSKNKLANSGDSDRCCNPDGTTFSDSRCAPGSGAGGSGGSAGSASSEGGSSAGGEPTAVGGVPSSGGVPSVPNDSAGAAGTPVSNTGGLPAMTDGGAGGLPATPSAGQGGAD